jgi:hypothetical protein
VKTFFPRPNFFLAISSQFCQLPTPELNSLLQLPAPGTLSFNSSFLRSSGRTHRKHLLSTIVPLLGFVAESCLPSSCLAVDVSFDFTVPSFGRYVTILSIHLRLGFQSSIFIMTFCIFHLLHVWLPLILDCQERIRVNSSACDAP